MRSSDLLRRISELVQQSPHQITSLSPEDIVGCVFVELFGLRQLYSKSHYEELEKRLFGYAEGLERALDEDDRDKVLSIITDLISILDALPDSEVSQEFIEKANYNNEYIRHRHEKTVIVLGDSHVNYFSGNEELSFVPIGNNVDTCRQINGLPITVLHLGACLAYKSDQYGSTSGFREKLDWLLSDFITSEATIILSLGEIDLRAHVLKQAQLQSRDSREIIKDILSHYSNCIKMIKSSGHQVCVWGPIASQNDDAPITEDHPRVGSVYERNAATRIFNDMLRRECEEIGAMFMSLFYEMVDEDMSTKREYLSSDMFHLGQYSFAVTDQMMKRNGLL